MSQNQPSVNHQQPTLKKLVRRLILSFSITLIGSWGMIIPRLFILHFERTQVSSNLWFYIDVTSLFLTIFGVLMVIYNHSLITPRLDRLKQLGEATW